MKNLKLTGPILLDTSKNDNFKYVEELDTAVETDSLNIGLSGTSGSGKSSIIKTFTEDRDDTIVVSLSNYNEENTLEEIEKDIIRVLAFSNYKEEIHGSKIKRLSKHDNKGFFKFSIVFILSSITGCFLGGTFANTFINKLNINCNMTLLYILFAIYLMIFGICLVNIIFHVISKLVNDKKDNTLYDLIAEEHDTPIKKYMLELIKIFRYNDKGIVIFEDIDTIDNKIALKLLEDLKSANNIINNAAGLEDPIKFIYCVNDSLFKTAKSRSKFFDVIISVVPVSTSFNSLMISSNLLDECEIEIDSKLIEIVSNRITDIRLIKCIINDYLLFDEVLNVDNKNYLFSLAVFKNIYIKEYEDINNIIKERIKNPSKEDDLLSDLIINGYIDDNYIDYISKPIDKLNDDDNKYLFNINHSLESYNIKITNMKSIINYLNKYYKIDEYILNNSLVDYIMNKKDLLYKDVLSLFKNLNNFKYNFLKQYKEYNKELFYKLVSDLNDNNINLWNEFRNSKLTDDSFFASSIYYLKLCANDLDSIELLRETIDNNLEINDIKYNKILLDNIKNIDVKFSDIDKYKRYTKYIIDNLLFKINIENINSLAKKKILFKDKCKEYILANLDEYEIVYMNNDLLIKNNSIIEIILNSDVSKSFKKEIISREEFIIDITNIDKDLVIDLYKNDRVNVSWTSLNLLETVIDSKEVKEYIINNKNTLMKNTSDFNKVNLKLAKLIVNTYIDNNLYKDVSKLISNYEEIKLTINKNSTDEEIIFKVNNNMLELTEGNTVLINKLDSKYINKYYSNITDYKKLYTIIKKKKLEVLPLLKNIKDINELCNILVSVNKDYNLDDYINVLFKKNKKYKVEYTKDFEKVLKKNEIEYLVNEDTIEFKVK